MKELFYKYLNILYDYFLYDISVFSNWWMYAPLLIPAILYLIFCLFKWSFLLIPIWMPIRLAISGISGIFSTEKDGNKNSN
jgi:hypothetical protein